MIRKLYLFVMLSFLTVQGALAQDTPFGVAQSDKSLPVEVSSETLTVKDDENTAIFTGNVIITQGELRLNAPEVTVIYLEDQSGIKTVKATGGVLMISGKDAAEGREATYVLDSGTIVMTGDVLLTRENNAITGNVARVNIRTGTANVTGNVKTILRPKNKN